MKEGGRIGLIPPLAIALLLLLPLSSAEFISPYGNKPMAVMKIRVVPIGVDAYNVTATLYNASIRIGSTLEDQVPKEGALVTQGLVLEPLAGKKVKIYAGSTEIGSGDTDIRGQFTAKMNLTELKNAQSSPFDKMGCLEVSAEFDGDDEFSSASVSGGLYCLTKAQELTTATEGMLDYINEDDDRKRICLMFFLFMGFLMAGMYAAGSSPLKLLDITTPRVPASRRKPEIRLSKRQDESKQMKEKVRALGEEIDSSIKKQVALLAEKIAKKEGKNKKQVREEIEKRVGHIKSEFEAYLKSLREINSPDAIKLERNKYIEMRYAIGQLLISISSERLGASSDTTRSLVSAWGTGPLDLSDYKALPDMMRSVVAYADAKMAVDLLTLVELRATHSKGVVGHGALDKIAKVPLVGSPLYNVLYKTAVTVRATGDMIKSPFSAINTMRKAYEARGRYEALKREREQITNEIKSLKERELDEESRRQIEELQKKLIDLDNQIVKTSKEASIGSLPDILRTNTDSWLYFNGLASETALAGIHLLYSEIENKRREELKKTLETYEKARGENQAAAVERLRERITAFEDTAAGKSAKINAEQHILKGDYDAAAAVLLEGLYKSVEEKNDRERGRLTALSIPERFEEAVKIAREEGVSEDVIREAGTVAKPALEVLNPSVAARVEANQVYYPPGTDDEISRLIYVAREMVGADPIKYDVAPTTQDEQLRRLIELDPYLRDEVREALEKDGYQKAIEVYRKGLESEEGIEATHTKFVTPNRYAERIEDISRSQEMKQFLLHEREFMTLVDALADKGLLPEKMTIEEFGKYSELYKNELREIEAAKKRGDAEAVLEHEKRLEEARRLKETEDKIRQLGEYYAREMAEIDSRANSISQEDYNARASRLQARVLRSLSEITHSDVTGEFMRIKANFEDPKSQLRQKFESDYKSGGLIEKARAEFRRAAAFNRATSRAKQYNLEEDIEKLTNRAEWEKFAVEELFANAILFNSNRRTEILALNRSLGYLVGGSEEGAEQYEYDAVKGAYKTFNESKRIARERAAKEGRLVDNTEDIILGMEEQVADIYRKAFTRFFRDVAEGKYADRGFSPIVYGNYYQKRIVNGREKEFIMGLDPEIDAPTQFKRLFDKSGFKVLEEELLKKIAKELEEKGIVAKGAADEKSALEMAKNYLGFYDSLQKLDIMHPGLFLPYEAALKYTWIQKADSSYMALPQKKVFYDTLSTTDKLINYAVDKEGNITPVTPSKWQRFYVELEKFGNAIVGGHLIGLMAEATFTGTVFGRHGQLTKVGGPGQAGTAEHWRLNRNAELADPLLDAYKWRMALGKLDEKALDTIEGDIGPKKIIGDAVKAISKAKVRIEKEIAALEADKTAAQSRKYFDDNVRAAAIAQIDEKIALLKEDYRRLDALSKELSDSKTAEYYTKREGREKDIEKIERLIAKLREEVGEFLMSEKLTDMVTMSPNYAEEYATHIDYARKDLEHFKEMAKKIATEITDACKAAKITDGLESERLLKAIDAERDVHRKALLAINGLGARMRFLQDEIAKVENEIAAGPAPQKLNELQMRREVLVAELGRVTAAHEMLKTTVVDKAKDVSERIGWHHIRGAINRRIEEECVDTALTKEEREELLGIARKSVKADERASSVLSRVDELITDKTQRIRELELNARQAAATGADASKMHMEIAELREQVRGLQELRNRMKDILSEARDVEARIKSDKKSLPKQIEELNRKLLVENVVASHNRFKSELLGKIFVEPLKAAFRRKRQENLGDAQCIGRPRMFKLSDEMKYYDARVLESNNALSPMNKLISEHMRNYAFMLDKFLEFLQMRYKTLAGRMHHRQVAAHLGVGSYSGFQFSGPLSTSLFQHLVTYGKYGNSGWITALLLQTPAMAAIKRYKDFYPFLTTYLSDVPTMTSPMGRRATKRSLLNAVIYSIYKEKAMRIGEMYRPMASESVPAAFAPYLYKRNIFGERRISELSQLFTKKFKSTHKGPIDALNYTLYRPNDALIDVRDTIFSLREGRPVKKTPEHLMDVGIYAYAGNSKFIAGREIEFFETSLGGASNMYPNRTFNAMFYNPHLSLPNMRLTAYGDIYKRCQTPAEVARDMNTTLVESKRIIYSPLIMSPLVVAMGFNPMLSLLMFKGYSWLSGKDNVDMHRQMLTYKGYYGNMYEDMLLKRIQNDYMRGMYFRGM